MPHIVLEYSNNLPDAIDVPPVLRRLHDELAALGPFALDDIKSRAIAFDRFIVAAGAPDAVFAHVTVSIMTGRDVDVRKAVSAAMLAVLREGFASAFAERVCS